MRRRSTKPATLTIIIDTPPHEKTFTLTHTLITTNSRLLAKAAAEAPSPNHAIALPGLRAADFEAYATYYNTLPRPSIQSLALQQWEAIRPREYELSPEQDIHIYVATLLGLHTLASVLMDAHFTNAVMHTLLSTCDFAGAAGAAIVQSAGCILANAEAGSGLYRLLVDVMAASVTEEFVERWSSKWTKEFVVDLLLRCVSLRGGKGGVPSVEDEERYFEEFEREVTGVEMEDVEEEVVEDDDEEIAERFVAAVD